MNSATGFGDIAINTTGTDESFDQLCAAAEHFASFQQESGFAADPDRGSIADPPSADALPFAQPSEPR